MAKYYDHMYTELRGASQGPREAVECQDLGPSQTGLPLGDKLSSLTSPCSMHSLSSLSSSAYQGAPHQILAVSQTYRIPKAQDLIERWRGVSAEKQQTLSAHRLEAETHQSTSASDVFLLGRLLQK